MGLAASQARLLTITARKADCEFQSMSISHQKIALARDMEKISDEYQAALNKTKLVYDYYGSGLSQINLDYNMLMTPSVYNDYYPKLVTDSTNKVVLNAQYAAAARKAGIPAEGYLGTPSSAVRNRFIEALCDNNAISVSTAASIKSVTYNNAIGLGNFFSYNTSTKDITYEELLELIAKNSVSTKDYGVLLGGGVTYDVTKVDDDYGLQWGAIFRNIRKEKTEFGDDSHKRSDGMQVSGGLYIDGNLTNQYEAGGSSLPATITLTDLLKDESQYMLALTERAGMQRAIETLAVSQRVIVGRGENDPSFLNWMTDQFASVLGGVSTNDQALQYAYDQVYDLLYPNENVQNVYADWHDSGKHGDDSDGYGIYGRSRKTIGDKSAVGDSNDSSMTALAEASTNVSWHWKNDSSNDTRNAAADYLGFVTGYNEKNGNTNGQNKNTHGSTAINLNNLAKVFLTAYVEYLQGLDNTNYSYNMAAKNTQHLYEAKNDDIFTIAWDSGVDSGDENAMAAFYDTLFNLICSSGWTENDKLSTDSAYMQEMLKTGAVYISSINNDGYYYQGSYNTDTYISEIADTEAIAQAEAKYNSEKTKIENKENRLDVKMKNLDTEISSLTTEYDTVKSVISKSIEKSFKRYDA